MTTLTLGRIAAALLSLTTFVFLFLHDSWRADNPFLVPDLILCAALLAAAATPARLARPALAATFCYSAGVLATSVAAYAVDGRLGLPSLLGVALCVTVAGALLRPAALRAA